MKVKRFIACIISVILFTVCIPFTATAKVIEPEVVKTEKWTTSYYIDDDIALAHRRLSIIDLDGGSQPIYNEKKDKVIVFNGEIYNYKEIKENPNIEIINKKRGFKSPFFVSVI